MTNLDPGKLNESGQPYDMTATCRVLVKNSTLKSMSKMLLPTVEIKVDVEVVIKLFWKRKALGA
jgi:hypothetical protein